MTEFIGKKTDQVWRDRASLRADLTMCSAGDDCPPADREFYLIAGQELEALQQSRRSRGKALGV